ncbi:MAG: flagellar biosynthesis anti-sigma factor FlgM [Burkholderiales bacterium]|nr:flagellar biosynthesis anti-sigma factor FlgM [Burkholderiales bacterium]
MKVNGSGDPLRPDPAASRPASRPAASGVRPPESEASIRLSGASAALAPGAASSEFDVHRVAEIKQAIRDGRFEVDSGVVADKLIANVNDLFGRTH